MPKKPPALPPRARSVANLGDLQGNTPGILISDADDNHDEHSQHLSKPSPKSWQRPVTVSNLSIPRSSSLTREQLRAGVPSPLTDSAVADIIADIEQLMNRNTREVESTLRRWVNQQKAPSPSASVQLQEEPEIAKEEVEEPPGAVREAFASVMPGEVADEEEGAPAKSPSIQQKLQSAATKTSDYFAKRSSTGIATKTTPRGRNKKLVSLFVAHHEIERTQLQKVVDSRAYEWASILLILLNSAFIGWQTEFTAGRAAQDAAANIPQRDDSPSYFIVLSFIFNILFLIDLVARWSAAGFISFWRTEEAGWSDDLSWNALDVFIVLTGLMDCVIVIISLTGTDDSGSNMSSGFSIARVVRIVRIVKVARVIRVMKFFRELRMMIFSIMNSMKSLAWVILILTMMFYVFGITFVSGVLSHLDTTDKWNQAEHDNLVKFFGSLDRAIISLYMAMSGGNDWCVYFEALELTQSIYHWLFLLFITFAIFAVVNIVTGVFVESAMQSSTTDAATMVAEELEVKKAKLASMKEVFENLDEDGTGTFTIDEFENRLRDERVAAYFSTLKLDVGDAKALFRLLDYDQSNEITIDEFVEGCSSLQGEARSLDAKIMQFELKFIKEAVCDITSILHNVESLVEGPKAKDASSSRPAKNQTPSSLSAGTSQIAGGGAVR
eukprot:TRINITY_DN61546_c0_g1_i1.p1 TRINITY_DN61546_c0_g1~~TRINITY_DN61546_c0_g1_i1.p1  ORF type:complete len:668 (-),score=136.38 TRINITY_DN61546_c0_g1_i1:48-2051(-)